MNLSFDIIAGKIDSRACGDSLPQAGYDCVEVTSKMYLNVTLDATGKHINQDTADELAKLLSAIKSQIEDTVNYIETQYHVSIEYAVDIA